jgi:cell division septation protein DedD
MFMNTDSPRDAKGLSTRHLILVFLAGIAVCGVFFSLGFLVGYNERSVRLAPVTERVSAPATIPPTINPPLETVPVGTNSAATSTPTGPPPPAALQAGPPRFSPSEQKPKTASATPPPVIAHPSSPAKAEKQPVPGGAATAAAGVGPTGAGFTVQITASRTKQDAEALVKVLKGRGYPVFLVGPDNAHANDNLYRVQVGPFASRDDAEKARTKLTKEGFKPFIRH